jgi:class 3 adenylate cyclase/tetratricopeptide (TPR) repeat protein/ABC-type lipoprotein export system ATPase subunit
MADGIDHWLETLELGRYAKAFTDNEIGVRDLPILKESDLVELGLPIGPRRRVMPAISELGETPAPEPTVGADAVDESRSPEAERRQLTVMFVDLVGSTELSGRLDPEDLRSLMQRYQVTVAGVIEANGGYLANWLGDGAIVYFGWPSAGEDQAARAVRAGLEAVAAVGQLPLAEGSMELLAARVGIATGQVVVGDLEDGEVGSRGMVTGETPNLAARLQGIAEPGGVVIGQTTRALVRTSFILDFLGSQNLKGFDMPVDAWTVTAESAAENRFEAPDQRLTAFTGRTHEVGLLLDRWHQARESEGQVALISGEPGIGKSRILRAFRDLIEGDEHRLLLYQCSPHHVNSALYPVIRQLEHAAELSASATPDQKLDRLEALLRRATPDIAETAPLIAAHLSLPFEERYGPIEIGAQQQRVATLHALRDQVLGLARQEPVLFVLEDAHWIDPTTLELITEIVPRLTDQRVLMLITHRPEWQPPFQGQGQVTTLNLTRLSRAQVAAIVRDVAGEDLSESAIARITERTDGVPLFVEELTKTMAEAGFELAEADVPVTLQASLMARLDRLGAAKEIAQIGAVIGREFSRGLLEQVVQRSEVELTAGLDRLMEAQLIFRASRGGVGEVYTFKHALIQDVAYESLLRQRRRLLHLAIAQALSKDENSGAAPEVLAQHFELGADLNNALAWSEAAGNAAVDRSAQPEAVAHISNALRLFRMIGQRDDEGQRELSLLLQLGQAQFGAIGGGAPETIATFERAGLLATRLHDTTARVKAHYGQYVGQVLTGQLQQSSETAERVAAIARESGLEWIDMVAGRIESVVRYLMGDLTGGHEGVLRAMSHGDHVAREVPPGFAHNPIATIPPVLAHIEWATGNTKAAIDLIDETIASLVRARADANSIGFALTWAALLGAFERDADRVHAAATHLRDHSKRTGGQFWGHIGNWGLGTAELLRGNANGLALVRTGSDGFVATGALQHVPFLKLSLVEGHALNGDMTEALGVLDEISDLIQRTDQRFYEPEMHRLRGVVLEKVGRTEEAVAAYENAVAVAEGQGSIPWRDRAAANLSALNARD